MECCTAARSEWIIVFSPIIMAHHHHQNSGDYSSTCSNCYLTNSDLVCDCKDKNQEENSTSIDLGMFNTAKRGDEDKLIICEQVNA